MAVLAIQALIITIAPSTAPTSLASSLTPGGGGFSAVTGPGSGATGTGSGATGTGAGTGAAGSGTGAGSGTTAGGGATSGTGGRSGTGAFVAGDTSHCVGGREFATSIVWYAPPCAPGTIGAADPNNGGATTTGVTGNQITIVDYVTNYGPEVNAILQAEGLYVSYASEQLWDQAMTKFINTHFVLYGRSVNIVPYQGKCQSVPPDTTCLTAEMDSIVQTYHPYIVMWVDNTLCSTCYAELAKDHAIAIGGIGFSDQMSNELAPYFYSADESSSRIETAFAQWWCGQMSNNNDSSRVVSQAGTENPAQNFNGQPRRLGVISTNDPDNENTVTNILGPALQKDCGDKIWHTYFYSQNINTAAQQVSAGIAAMNTPTNPANAVLCLCDPVAPQFLYQGEADNNYWPENLVASDQGMDLDVSSQNYNTGAACPTANKCEYGNAFGLSPLSPQSPPGHDSASRVWQMEGMKASLASTMGSTANADRFLEQFIMTASLIENAGPVLTPANMQAAAPRMGTVGGGTTGHQLLGFAPGDWHWTQDNRVAYWDNNAKSGYNGASGTFCAIEGARFDLGQFPSEPSGPPIPSSRPASCSG
ncbi:MAG: hypothetical protein ACYCS7_06055 [Acidimicrobiales bacterium]